MPSTAAFAPAKAAQRVLANPRRAPVRLFSLPSSLRAAARRHAGCLEAAPRDYLRPGLRRTPRVQHGASMRTLARLATALGTTPEWLMSGLGAEEAGTHETLPVVGRRPGLRLGGTVAAGEWIEASSKGPEHPSTLVPPDLRYPENCQSAFEVRGLSCDRIARPGDFLIVVDREATNLPVRSGDVVMVIRNNQGLREVTARRVSGIPRIVISSLNRAIRAITQPHKCGYATWIPLSPWEVLP